MVSFYRIFIFICSGQCYIGTHIFRYKDGELLQDQSQFHCRQDDDICKLVFEEVMLEDAGVYCIQASNSAGSMRSEAELRVNGAYVT